MSFETMTVDSMDAKICERNILMKLKPVGFYKEFEYGYGYDRDESLYDVIAASPDLNEDKIICYLKSGEVFLISPTVTQDVLSKDKEFIDSLKILTDGIWAWSSDLAYYVKEYHITINKDFVSHMCNNGWVINKGAIDLDELEKQNRPWPPRSGM